MKQYLKLLMAREAKEVLGKRGTNLWLLTIVLVATFASIAFSEGSMIYLRDKMEDPFTNWVSIVKSTDDERFNDFRDSLYLDENKKRFDYQNVLMDQYTNYNITGTGEKVQYFSARFFENIKTPLVSAILAESNVVEGCEVDTTLLDDKTLGFIITMDAIKRIGYDEEHLPAYINYLAVNDGADSLGLKVVTQGEGENRSDFYPVAIPVLAVVKKLPNNVDMMSANFFYEQQHYNDHTHPFDFKEHEPEYLHQLAFYVSEKVGKENFEQFIKKIVPDSLQATLLNANDYYSSVKSWKPGNIWKIEIGDERMPRKVFQDIANQIEEHFNIEDVRRVHKLVTEEHPSPRSSFLSVEFNSLNHIREFETFAKRHGIQLEMEQVHSKENFNAVTVMAAILSGAMVIFSLVCIIMFLVNMLQSYFQKVKRNIGTFKAFGMNANELIHIYVLILVMIVCSAVVLALLITWCIQGLLPIVGVEKEGFNYLSLWNTTTYVATAIVVVSTIFTVSIVMSRMLSKTPGDLIYDRD
ncbi:MAG: ABC transporter permease [Bacteroidaceae bacterium]|nr:ABC transporter permease [Bacteroidaceae bacterium]